MARFSVTCWDDRDRCNPSYRISEWFAAEAQADAALAVARSHRSNRIALIVAPQKRFVQQWTENPNEAIDVPDAADGGFWPAFIEALRDRNLIVTHLALDFEGWNSYWGLHGRRSMLGIDHWREDRKQFADDIYQFQQGRAAMFVDEIRRDIVRPVEAIWFDVRVTQYGFSRWSAPMYDRNGWRMPESALRWINCPVLYGGLERARRTVLASIEHGTCEPWLGYPGLFGLSLEDWVEKVKMLAGYGVGNVLWFCPRGAISEAKARTCLDVFDRTRVRGREVA